MAHTASMKNIKLKSSLVSALISLLFLFPSFRTGSLKDITKPYLGVYECTEARLNDTDYLDKFSYIYLELKAEEEFVLHYCENGGEKKQETGKYVYDREKETLTLIGGAGGFFKREFPLKDGVLTINVRVGEQTLVLQFERK